MEKFRLKHGVNYTSWDRTPEQGVWYTIEQIKSMIGTLIDVNLLHQLIKCATDSWESNLGSDIHNNDEMDRFILTKKGSEQIWIGWKKRPKPNIYYTVEDLKSMIPTDSPILSLYHALVNSSNWEKEIEYPEFKKVELSKLIQK